MDSSSRHPLCDVLGVGDDDLEEGEYVPGHYQSSSDTDDDRFDRSSRREDDVVHPQHGGRTRRLEDIIAAGRVGAVGAPLTLPPSPTPSSESDEGTISDYRSASSAGGGGARPARNFACHVCGKGFSSRKAVDGHMRVHSSGSGSGCHVVAQPDALSAGWAATGRRGWTGGKGKPSAAAASLNSECTGQSTAIVAVQVQPMEPVPMAFAVATNLSPMPSSTRTNLSGEDDEGSSAASATATAQPMHYDEPVAAAAAAAVVTGANPSSSVAGAGAGARAAGPVEHQLAAVANQAPAPQDQFAQQPLVAPPAAAVQLQQGGQLVPLPRPAQPPREYSCKACGKTYPSHQGLGGHAAGHKNRQREQEAMAAAAGMMMMPHGGGGGGDEFLAALRRGRKAQEPHACQKCHKVFATGVALGGHMRMHYTGPPIVHKSKKRCMALASAAPPPPAVSEADLRLALSTAKAEAEPSSAAPAVAGTGRLRLFGVDIGPLGQAPSEQQESGTTEGSSSDGEQQHK